MAAIICVLTVMWLPSSFATSASACSTIACFKKHDAWFAAHMDNSAPLFVTSKNDGDILTYISQPAAKRAVQIALDRLNKDAHDREKRITPHSPLSCAVVGNSDNLIGSRYGAQIDNHAYVFRMNNAPIGGENEKDVGKRITFNVKHWGSITSYTPDTVHILMIYPMYGQENSKQIYRHSAQQLLMIASQFLPDPHHYGIEHPQHLDTWLPDLNGGIRLMHPDFLRYITREWFPKDLKGQTRPSTGLRTLVLALHMCDSVDVYGFGMPRTPGGKWHHYYAGTSPASAKKHMPEFQESILQELQKRGIIHRYMGNEKPFNAKPLTP